MIIRYVIALKLRKGPMVIPMGWMRKLTNESGQVAIIFALSIIPVFAVAGFALDFQNTIKKKQKVQLVVDSAVLAAARLKQTGASER